MISFLNQRILLRSAIASLSLIFISFSATAYPQQQNDFGTSIPGTKVLLMASDVNENTTVPAPPILPQAERLVNIVVNYNGFSADAQTAFQAAVDIWESILVGNQTINITANWTPLNPNVLGSAGPAFFHINFPSAPLINTYYPTPLANELCGCDNTPGAEDIIANFNSDFGNWYLGTDGATPAGQYDFMSVVLHEIGHGLGFLGSANVDDDGVGEFLWANPAFYDTFVDDVNFSILAYADPSPALTSALQGGGNLMWNGANGVAGNGGAKPELFDPNPWSPGSSYSHFAESYFLAGNVNSLMTPTIGMAESIHDPGPACLGLLEDLGWGINYEYGCIEDACTDPFACNYHPDACDAGSCIYCGSGNCVNLTLFDSYGDGWNGASWEFLDEMGVSWANGTLASGFEFTEIFCLNSGCYNFAVTTGSWPSEVSWELVGANGGVITGVASESMSVSFGDVDGCTNPIACNYDPDACIDDGSCDYYYSTPTNLLDTEWYVEYDFGCDGDGGIAIWNLSSDFTFVSSWGSEGNWSLCGLSVTFLFESGTTEYNGDYNIAGGYFEGTINGSSDNCFTMWLVVEGCTDSTACNYNAYANVDDGSCNNQAAVVDMTGANWYLDFDSNCAGGGIENTILTLFYADNTWEFIGYLDNGWWTLCGTTLELWDGAEPVFIGEWSWGDFTFSGPLYSNLVEVGCGVLYLQVEGCTDANACNYDASATTDDGSCLYPTCNDPLACNYDECSDPTSVCYNALDCYDASTCTYAIAWSPGCTYSDATNYDPTATFDDGSCEYDLTSMCGAGTYFDAVTSTCLPDGSGTGGGCPGDLDNDGFINTSDLLAFLAVFGSACL